MTCASCSGAIERMLRATTDPAVVSADVNLLAATAAVTFVAPPAARDAAVRSLVDLVEEIEAIGFDASVLTRSGGSIELVQLEMLDTGKESAFEEALRKIDGVKEVTMNQGVATVGADFGIAPPRRVLDELGAAGLHATLAKDAEVSQAIRRSMEAGAWRRRFLLSFGFTVPLTVVMLLAMFSPAARRALMIGPFDAGSLMMWAFA